MDTTKPMQERPESERHHAPGRAAPPRRRPSGEPPPLPHQLGRTGKFWLFMVGYFVGLGREAFGIRRVAGPAVGA